MRGVRRAALVALFLFCDVANARDAVTAKQFIVSAAHPLAAEAGYAVLQLGGSALDAAVAVQMVLGLVEPESSGIGGGAFLLHWSEQEKRLRTYDGRETAPAAARPDRFLDAGKKPKEFYAAAVGGRSVGVPGVLRLLELAHRQHGRLPWSELLQDAMFAAEEGFVMSPGTAPGTAGRFADPTGDGACARWARPAPAASLCCRSWVCSSAPALSGPRPTPPPRCISSPRPGGSPTRTVLATSAIRILSRFRFENSWMESTSTAEHA